MDMDARRCTTGSGPEKLKQKVAVIDEYKVFVEVAIFYAAWGIMTWMLTLGKHFTPTARQWVASMAWGAAEAGIASSRRDVAGGRRRPATGLAEEITVAATGDRIRRPEHAGMIAMLVVEVMMLLKEIELPAWFLPAMTAHELIQLGHNLFPAFLNGCRCIGAYLFVDLDGPPARAAGRAPRAEQGGAAGSERYPDFDPERRRRRAGAADERGRRHAQPGGRARGQGHQAPVGGQRGSDGFPDGEKKSNTNLPA